MINFTYILISVYSFLGTLICIGYFLQNKKEKKIFFDSSEDRIKKDQINVIIPFRNESQRISKLIHSINLLSEFPHKFIFVNDHSEDDFSSCFEKLNYSIPFEIIHLPKNLHGKKAAIRYAIQFEKIDYNLTWDADINFEPTYFEKLEKLKHKDLYILPVVMKGENFLQQFYESDHAIANAINYGISGLKRPFLASGANLLFNQKAFLETDNYPSHSHISSGDDLFLLSDFRNHHKSIELISDYHLAVQTESPQTFKEFVNQRLRWIGKGKAVNDSLSNLLAFISLAFNILFIGTFIYLLCIENWIGFLFLFTAKSLIDLLVYLPYFIKIKRLKTWSKLPFFSVLQPFYLIFLSILLFTYQPKWKGRMDGE